MAIKLTISGENIHITNSKEGKAVEFALYGKATQDGTPTPENPQEIEVSGESYNLLKNNATSKTANGITFTVNEDKSIKVNGTATAQTHCSIYYGNEIPKGSYILSQGIKTTQGVGVVVDALESQTVGVRRLATFYNGNIAEFENDYSDYNFLNIYIVVDAGITVSKTFYPMIRKASVKNDRYMPYRKGSVEVISSNVDNTKTITATIPTPNGLAGIKVSSGGNYTDQNGQQWICDEVVKYADGSGAYIQRVKPFTLNGSETWSTNADYKVYWTNSVMQDAKTSVNPVICDSYIFDSKSISTMADKTIKQGIDTTGTKIYLYIRDTSFSTVSELNAFLTSNNVKGYYILAQPITTPLTAEELAEISTFYPVTNISNDFDCGMSIKYVSTLVEFKEPKTDWTEKSRFNIEDYNRIKNNLEWLYQKAVYLNRPFEIEDMGEDIVDYLSYWKVSSFNAFEDNIEAINKNILTKDYGTPQRFYENGAFIRWTELNRIESAILSMKEILENQEKGLRKIPFVLGRFRNFRV